MYENYKNDISVTWNNDWIREFESPWSIFEKLKYANVATANDIFLLLGPPQVKKSKYGVGKFHRNLITLEGIDDTLVKKILGIELKNILYKN
ncbi:MAG: hypothetical protein LPK26_01715, partial [Bacillaceae bacterium]|nr:hypothetical protein [Bacillaceae bacterium]